MIINLKAGFEPNTNRLFRFKALISSKLYSGKVFYKNIPVIINNYNRLNYLERLISWLEKAGMKKIYIIDNNSSYPLLLEYYRNIKYTVFRLNKNVGHTALWDTHIFMMFRYNYYIYTDSDILPTEECPLNVVEYFYNILGKYHKYTKVGFGLKIDDIPNYYSRKKEVIEWESKYWKDVVEEGLYKARIDTTFALYKPGARLQQWDRTLRTGNIYMARHLPWYEDDNKPNEEELYFRSMATEVSSWYKKGYYRG